MALPPAYYEGMAAAYRDLDPATFDPDSNLLDYAVDLEMTSLVGMVDPARAESKAAVADAQRAHIRVRMVTGDDVVTGAAIARELGIELHDQIAGFDERARLHRHLRDLSRGLGLHLDFGDGSNFAGRYHALGEIAFFNLLKL